METFLNWLQSELDSRGWKQADLSRESGLDSAVISNILNGHRRVGESTASAISQALNLPPETVFRKAGILPPKPDTDETIQEIEYIYDQLNESSKTELLEYAKLRLKLQEEKKTKPHPKTKTKPVNS